MAEPIETPRPTSVTEVIAQATARIVVDTLVRMDDDAFAKAMQHINDARAEVQRIRDEEYPEIGDSDLAGVTPASQAMNGDES